MSATEQASDVARWIDHPSGWLALSPRNERFTVGDRPGFVAYRARGRHLVAFGGVHAPPEERAPLLTAFLAHAAAQRRRALFVQVRAEQAPLFQAEGFTLNRFGASYALSVAQHRLSGGARMKLRQKVRRAEKLGLRVLELGRELPRDAEAFRRLAEISAVWLRKKKKKELELMVGELGAPEDTRRRVLVAVEPDGRWAGFISYVPVYGARPGYLHDLTRRLPDAPPGTMELVNHTALERLRAEGVPHLHFGFTPFILPDPDAPEPTGASRFAAWVIRLLARRGSAIYPAEDQVRYKQKWAPDQVESELIAFRPLSLRAIWDLLLVTRSI